MMFMACLLVSINVIQMIGQNILMAQALLLNCRTFLFAPEWKNNIVHVI